MGMGTALDGTKETPAYLIELIINREYGWWLWGWWGDSAVDVYNIWLLVDDDDDAGLVELKMLFSLFVVLCTKEKRHITRIIS